MRIIFNTLIACTMAICSTAAFGLGVSDITVQSALNQPLTAVVELRDTDGVREGQLSVRLASVADFKTVGVDYLAMLTELQFDVRFVNNIAKEIIITTRQPVREPYLNFLVEIRWSSGRIVKEYAAFLDPVFSDTSFKAQTESVAQQISRSHNQAPPPQPVYQAPDKPETRLTRSNDTNQQVMVMPDDTLWGISQRFKPSGVTIQQTMLAIQSANPNAFIAGNMNGLKAGYILNIPAEIAIRDVSLSNAVRETERAEQLWNSQAKDASASSYQTRPVAELKLAAGDSTGTIAAVQNSEINDALSSENTELKDRLQALESQVDQLQRLLELKNQQLAQVQSASELAKASTDVAPVPVGSGSSASVAEVETDIAPDVDVAEAAPEASSGAVDAPVDEQALTLKDRAIKPLPPVELQAPKTLFEQLWLRLGVLVLVLVGLVIALVKRRKSNSDELIFEEADVDLSNPVTDSFADAGDIAPEMQSHLAEGEQQALEQLFESMPYQDAMAELEQRVENEAHRADLRLFLLQKAANSGDKDRFVDNFRTLDAIGKTADVDSARRVLVNVTGSSAWLEPVAQVAADVPTMIDVPELDGVDSIIDEPADELDDFFKQIATEEELTDEIEALLMASEGATSLDQQDFEDFDIDSLGTEPDSLDELMADTELDQLADTETADSEPLDDGDALDFSSTLILPPDNQDKQNKPEASDDDDDLDFDLADLGFDTDVDDTEVLDEDLSEVDQEVESDTDTDDDLEFDKTVALEMDQTHQTRAARLPGDDELGHELLDIDLAAVSDDRDDDEEIISLDALDDDYDLREMSESVAELEDEDEDEEALSIDDAELDAMFDLSDLEADDDDDNDELDLSAVSDDLDSELFTGDEPLLIDSESDGLNAIRGDDVSFFADEERAENEDDFDDSPLDLTGEIDLDALADGGDFDASEDGGDYEDFSSLLEGLEEDAASEGDEIATKLELAKAFIEMDDIDAAKEIIDEVLQEGDIVQQAAARELLDNFGG